MNLKFKISGKDFLGYLLLFVSVAMLLKSLMLCQSNDIWYDELFTVGMAEHSYSELTGLTARDVHPPLYYMIVRFFLELCKLVSVKISTISVIKMVSVLPYFILLLYSITLLRKRFSMFTGGLFLFCSIAMPQLSAYTVEMRMYSWALLFVTAAFLHAYEIVCGSGSQRLHGAALVCYGLAAAYTQYFACVAVIMVYLYVLVVWIRRERGRIKAWVCWVLVSVMGYIPWLFILYRQIAAVHDNYWILPLSWRTLGGCVKFLMKPAFTNEVANMILAVVFFAVYPLIFLCATVKLCHNERDMHGKSRYSISLHMDRNRLGFMLAGVGVLAGLVLFGFAVSILVRPVFVYRYMIPAMGCFWLIFAAGLDNAWTVRTVPRVLLGVVLVFVTLIGLRDYRAFMGEEEYKIRLMKETEAALFEIDKDDIVIYNFDQVQAVTSYYLPAETDSYLWCGTPEVLIQDLIRPFEQIEETEQIKAWCESGRRVWFIGSFNSRDDVVAEWAAEGVKAEETGSYLLERYWFNLYRISL